VFLYLIRWKKISWIRYSDEKKIVKYLIGMSETVIKVNNISKMYDLGLVGTGTLSKDLNRAWARFRGKPDPYATLAELNDRTMATKSGSVWALKDINFEVKQGEVLGIVGKNGAGKSTLLKILSQITSPTTGNIKIKGRIASLLEVGTGMHPEMTARQNIYLNGAIMGMTRVEITRKLDEIVDFAGIEKYIDTPTKRFSSGMTVRLGFAVAAFLEPEILIVDEVLAVGDAEFQKKAIGKMKDVSKGEGRTVLFVSHNMASVKSLCNRGLLIDKGQVRKVGNVDDVLVKYHTSDSGRQNFNQVNVNKGNFVLNSVGVRNLQGDYRSTIQQKDEVVVVLMYENNRTDQIDFTIKLKGEDGQYFLTTSTAVSEKNVPQGKHIITMKFPSNFFNEGLIFMDVVVVSNRNTAFIIESDICSFNVNPNPKPLGSWMSKAEGYLKPAFNWQTNIE
jgi:lipopolysaccharide transport system ATP-binding protein